MFKDKSKKTELFRLSDEWIVYDYGHSITLSHTDEKEFVQSILFQGKLEDYRHEYAVKVPKEIWNKWLFYCGSR